MYPTSTSIIAFAAQHPLLWQWGVFAYAAIYNTLPADINTYMNWQNSVPPAAAALGVDPVDWTAYASANGAAPQSAAALVAWQTKAGVGTITPATAARVYKGNAGGGGTNDPFQKLKDFWEESNTNKAIVGAGVYLAISMLSGGRGKLL